MGTSPPVPISRTPGVLTVHGIRATTLTSLLGTLKERQCPTEVVAADLSLGTWRGQQVAAEFYAQLGLAFPPPQQVLPSMGRSVVWDAPLPYADVIGTWIDAEAGGDRTTLTALDLASRIVTAVATETPRTFLVLAPRFGLSWEIDNVLFLRFLVQGLDGTDSRVLIVHTDTEAPSLPDNWQVHWTVSTNGGEESGTKSMRGLVPGVLQPDVAAVLTAGKGEEDIRCLLLPRGHVLIAPEYRRSPRTVSRFAYDQLAVKTRGESLDWLQAYAQFSGNNLYAEPLFLCKEAWQRFAEGGYGVALRLMERAIACAPTLEQQGFFRAQAQGIRIGLQRFAEAALEPDPSPALAPAVQGFLFQSKGWGLVMAGNPDLAASYFQHARELLAPYYGGNREYLYLLNISALSRLESGDIAGALEIEEEIEAQSTAREERDWHLEYVNSINLARLHRRRQNADAAEPYYRKAFATTLGAKSESDAVYCNLCFSRVYLQRGLKAEAFLACLRAVLHWVSSRAPEALAPRVAKAILGHTPPASEDLPEAISAVLFPLLLSSATALPQMLSAALAVDGTDLTKLPAPVFLRTDNNGHSTFHGTMSALVGASGWSVGIVPWEVPSQYTGKQHRQLRALVCFLLQQECQAVDLSRETALVIDDCLGYEIAGTCSAMIETALRYDVSTVVFGSRVFTLDQETRRRLTVASRVRLGDAVTRIEKRDMQELVLFKRYFPPRTLAKEESRILSLLEQPPTVEELWQQASQGEALESFTHRVRMLERDRVVVLSLTEESGAIYGLDVSDAAHGHQ